MVRVFRKGRDGATFLVPFRPGVFVCDTLRICGRGFSISYSCRSATRNPPPRASLRLLEWRFHQGGGNHCFFPLSWLTTYKATRC
ncbi:hypothetical protein CSUI_004488 [Cystoisospora suis]|uniref:Uncharacterized protein n=1 Tax=Cystoisospora suis TaxID=483139 RepID=A0A2C6L1E1_9APIC|nr:hypothetical protein CSUI_004488 [Cystoisospora suis]